jgi:signal recognition particle subunit SEC65
MSENLEKMGWIKRTTIGEPRLSEIVELYKSLGYEVRVEPVKFDELDEECRRCYENDGDKLKTVYIRKKGS